MLSRKLINKNFQILAKSSYDFIETQNKKYIKRKRETDLHDAIAFKLHYTQKNITQLMITDKINDFHKSSTERSCYVDRSKLIDEKLIFDYYEHLDNKINELFYKKSNSYQIIAVDGIKGNAYASTKNQSFKTTKGNDIFTFLSIGFFNVTHNDPCLLRAVEHKNERKAFINNLTVNDNPTIYVTDRGFVDKKLFIKINDSHNYFICRIRNNSLIINNLINEQIITDYDEDLKYIRVINYKINDNEYHIITNIPTIMYKFDDIINIYHKRWNIEEYFKFIKGNMKMESFKERDWKSIQISVYMNFIVSKFTYLIFNLYYAKIKTQNRTVNKTYLTYKMYSDFFLKFIYNKKFSERYLIQFFKKAINIIVTHLNESNIRKSMYPHTKWYVKSHYNKHILEDII